MIKKLQTYLTRFINWLESNSETRFIRSVLSSNEDLELNRLYKEINHLRDRLRILIDKFTNDSLAYERAINHAYSHIKRKHKSLKLPHSQLKEVIGYELSVYSSQDAVIVANRLQKMLEGAKAKPHKVQYEMITQESETLSHMVLNIYRDIPTIESSFRETGDKNDF